MMTTPQTTFIAGRLAPDQPDAHHLERVITRGPAARQHHQPEQGQHKA
jgi:hypothetical protein